MNYKFGPLLFNLGEFVHGRLDVSRSNLTTDDLPFVTAVVEGMGPWNLVDLNLSRNRIELRSREEIRIFECFITYMVSLPALRLLDLSGNPLGPAAFRTLAWLHSEDAMWPTTRTDVRPFGFNGLPWLDLGDTGMTPADARHVAAMIASHDVPTALAKWAEEPDTPELQQQFCDLGQRVFGGRGIMWLPNDGLGDEGRAILQAAEDRRDENWAVDHDPLWKEGWRRLALTGSFCGRWTRVIQDGRLLLLTAAWVSRRRPWRRWQRACYTVYPGCIGRTATSISVPAAWICQSKAGYVDASQDMSFDAGMRG